MKISFYTLGCKANQADNAKIKSTAAQLGWQIVDYGKKCAFTIVNACAVTAGAEQRSRQMLRSAKQYADHVIASGCFIEKIPEIDLYFKKPDEVIDYLKNIFSDEALPQSRERTRALIRIQDGCNFNCSYCLIHKIRGKTQSRPADKIINEIKQKESGDYKEVILTGINILQYHDLVGLLKLILEKTTIARIRLGSIDPRLVTDKFLDLFKNPRLLPHIHLSLQSGSDRILRLMNRNYTADKYISIVERARKIDPLFSFTTDIIVGFPGETEDDVQATVNLIKQAQFTKVHLFPYSERPDTEATNMNNKIDAQTIKKRMNILEKESKAIQQNYIKKYIGKKVSVLIEEKNGAEWLGYSEYYFKVKTADERAGQNQVVDLVLGLDNIY